MEDREGERKRERERESHGKKGGEDTRPSMGTNNHLDIRTRRDTTDQNREKEDSLRQEMLGENENKGESDRVTNIEQQRIRRPIGRTQEQTG